MDTTIELTYTQVLEAIKANVAQGDMTPVYIDGAPGCGKTSLGLDVAEEYGIPRDVAERCIFRPSLRDPVDLAGLPHTERGADGTLYTYWAANSFIKYVNEVAEKYGIAFLIIDELPQAVTMMQNAVAGLVYDRFVGDNHLHENVYVIMTGNRVKDKAGAGRVVTQLGNRVEHLPMSVDLTAWSNFMLDKYGFDKAGMFVAYVRFDPGVLEDFDPDRLVNGSMRSCEAAVKIDPTGLSPDVYLAKLAGRIPEGRARSYITFRELADELPTAEEMERSPKSAKLPVGNRGACFAAASLAFKRADAETFPNLAAYVERIALEAMEMDIEAYFYKDVITHKPELAETPTFLSWATGRGAEVLL